MMLATVSMLLWAKGANLDLHWDTYKHTHWHSELAFPKPFNPFVRLSCGDSHSELVWNFEWWQIIALFLALPAIRLAWDIKGRSIINEKRPHGSSQSRGGRAKRIFYAGFMSLSVALALLLTPAMWCSHWSQIGSTWKSATDDGEVALVNGCFGIECGFKPERRNLFAHVIPKRSFRFSLEPRESESYDPTTWTSFYIDNSPPSVGEPEDIFYMHVPLFPLLALASVLPGWHLVTIPQRRSARRLKAGCCVRCGYDLRAASDRCPECGNLKSEPTVT
jgi:hypothetical protein